MNLPPDTAEAITREYPFGLVEVDGVDPLDRSRMLQYVDGRRPFVARGMVDSWPINQNLTTAHSIGDKIDLFRSYLNGADIRFTYTPAAQKGDIGIGPDLAPNFQMDSQSTSAKKFLQRIEDLINNPTGECVYAAALPLSELPNTLPHVSGIGEIGGQFPAQRNLWIGSGDHIVDLHFDMMRNFISMLTGVKRITLFPPEALPYIYPAPLHKPVAGVTRSLVKLLDVDMDRYPRFVSALKMARVVVLRPGDTLHIPPLWWHHVESYGLNAMVNEWFDDMPLASRQTFEKASIMMRRNIAGFADWPDEKIATLLQKNALCSEQSIASLPSKLRAIRDSLDDLPEYWREYLSGQYDYYVFRKHGDPYPTLPGMHEELADEMKVKFWRGVKRRLKQVISR